MRLGIAGCGRIAERGYVPAALAAEDVTIAGFADPDPARLRHCVELWERGGGDEPVAAPGLDDLLEAPIDLLVVAVPAAHHLELARQAARAGIPSLVEKPPAPDLAEAETLAALEPTPLLAFNRRFLQGPELRDSIPPEGWLELELELRFRRDAWGAHESRDEALLDAGIHLIDLACHLSAAAPIAVRGAEVEPERATFELELSRGRARIACATDRGHREAIAVRDRSGRQLANSTWGGLGARLRGLLGSPDPLALSLRRQLEALRDPSPSQAAFVLSPSIPGKGRTPVASAADGVAAMAVVEAARRSAALGGAEVTVTPIAGVPA
ncbi:MAG TPA: Gfo/Idh/MocA family oxidoreductase [Solirubrobacterales bacterium]|nr:Gfo/Idh/MocA family oxidoreductase [Solirubrobacterales bacterium]